MDIITFYLCATTKFWDVVPQGKDLQINSLWAKSGL